MRFSLSLKKTWYSLILLVAVVPALLMLVWSSTLYHQLLLEKHLVEEDFFRENVVDHVKHEVKRLGTLLENKSDPIAYTLDRDSNIELLDELLHKVITREPAVHALLIINVDGQIVTGMESYGNHTIPLQMRSGLQAHWQYAEGNFPDEVMQPLQGKPYIGEVSFHPEGVFFELSVPVGPPAQPVAVLLAHVDASILWQDLQPHQQRVMVNSYLVDASGSLLTTPADTSYKPGDSVKHFPAVKAFINNQLWQHNKIYDGLSGQPVFGNFSQAEDIGLAIITEVNHEHVLQPIRYLLSKMAIGAAAVIVLLVWLGMRMLKPVISSIDEISDDFKRVAKQDYKPSSISSSFDELKILVEGFNQMVSEIDTNQQDLKLASLVFENTSEGIIITNEKHEIVSINRAFSEITGYSEEDVIGKNPSILSSGKHDEAFYRTMWNSINKTGRWNGEIHNKKKNGEIYTELLNVNTFRDALGKLTYHIGVFTDISNLKETENKLDYLAHHDPLTDLPNRLLCHARMEHELQFAQRHKEQVAILFLDLDMFKNVNDSMGHAKGDVLLQQVAKRIDDSVRDEDTIARLGGDEFAIIIGSLKSRQDAALVAENTLALFSTPFYIEEQEVFIGVSVGISIFPDDGEDPDVLLRNADTAMYLAKSEGRNNYQFYTPALTKRASERLNIETSLRQAMDRNELQVYYQPQYSLGDGKMTGVEALLRWQHPEMGMVDPEKFISVAEETGLIVPIGEWVLNTACEQLKAWQDAGYPQMRMAVNLSARQFWKPGLDKIIGNILDKTGVEPVNLEFELTESVIMHDTLIVSDTLQALHRMGVGLAIDDFGTGYSSLSYIQRFPLDMLKIDRSFVEDITTSADDAAMIVSIIALAHSMKLQVLAEGVETKEQLLYLQEQGCDEVQGFYFSHPLTADELEKLLSKEL